jgi:hypothetical protein
MLAATIALAVFAGLSALFALGSLMVARRSANSAHDSAGDSRRSADAAQQSASLAAAADLRDRQPDLELRLERAAGFAQGEDGAIYEIINHGPQDLESVVVHRPQTTDSVRYMVARTGGLGNPGSDWGDEANLGRIPMTESARFTLAVGPHTKGKNLPEMRVRIICLGLETDHWEVSETLKPPRARRPGATSA